MLSGQTDARPEPVPADAAVQSFPAAAGVRIVRLSQVIGEAKMDRNTGRGYEEAFMNLPVVQGASLRTGKGAAEVEFEDGSTMRLAPETVLQFAELGRDANGGTRTKLNVSKGTVYVSRMTGKSGPLLLRRGDVTVAPEPGSHLRLTAADKNQLTVFHGIALVQSSAANPELNLSVAKKNTLLFDGSGAITQLVKADGEKTDVDEWDKTQVAYHERNGHGSAFGGSGYGVSDLNYYGSFADLPGCGQMWRPYFASAAWDPYSNGSWAYYSGAGYTWVSPYPWGWAPFHSGSWQNCGGSGWGWRPGGQFTGLNNAPGVLLHSPTSHRPEPPRPPLPGQPTVIPINTRPIAVSGSTLAGTAAAGRSVSGGSALSGNGDQFVFRKDSAGLGVPRETFGKLSHLSSGVEHHGVVSTSVAAPVPQNSGAPALPSRSVSRQTNSPGPSTPVPSSARSSAPAMSTPSHSPVSTGSASPAASTHR